MTASASRRRRRLRGAALLLPLSAAACGADGTGTADAFTVRDSAGIRIAESSGPAWAPGEEWSLSRRPALAIGTVDGAPEYIFGNITGVLGTSGGGVVVGDRQANTLRWFDAQGRHLRSTGRAGSGPGEFRMVRSVVRYRADTVAVPDPMNRRVSFFAPEGFVRDQPLGDGDGGLDDPIAYPRDGSVLLRLITSRGEIPQGLVRDSFTLGRRAADGETRVRMGPFPGGESLYQTVGGGGFSVIARAFGTCSCAAPAEDGFFRGSGEDARVVFHGADGAERMHLRWPGTRRPVTASDVAGYREREIARYSDRAWIEQLVGIMEYPAQMPVYDALRTDAEGNLWVRAYEPDSAHPSRWWVFSGEGRLLGTVTTPSQLVVQEIGTDYVVGVWRDEMDVQYVHRYTLHKPRG
jgi:hypothetical protein